MPTDQWYRPGWEDLSPADLVVLAWNIGTPMARRTRQARLAREWPALAFALDRLTVAKGKGAVAVTYELVVRDVDSSAELARYSYAHREDAEKQRDDWWFMELMNPTGPVRHTFTVEQDQEK